MNPFRYGCTVDGEFFCPRPELEQGLASYIESGQHVVIVGERRTGKSSLVLETVRKMKGMALFYVDFLSIRSRAELCNRLVAALARLEDSDSWLGKVQKTLLRLRPFLSIDPSSGAPTICIDAKEAAAPNTLDLLLDTLVAQTTHRRICVVFDEFQDILNVEDGWNALAVMRSRIQHDSRTPYVFLGSVRHQMLDIFLSHSSPFYHGAAVFKVGGIDADVFFKFLNNRFAKGGRTFPRAVFDAIADATRNTPGFIQELCDALWQMSADGDVLSDETLKKALDVIFAREQEHFVFAVKQLTALQTRVLKAVAVKGGREIYSGAFLEAVGTHSPASVKKAMSKLMAEGLVYFVDDEYRIDNPFLAEWMRRR